MECLLADLVYMARSKLDILGREFKFLPITSISNPPLDTLKVKNTNDADANTKSERSTFSNPLLQEAFQSEDAFDRLYIDITHAVTFFYL